MNSHPTKITSSYPFRTHSPQRACSAASRFRKTSVLRLYYNNPFAAVQNLRKSASYHIPVYGRMQEMPRKIFFHRVLNRGRRTESRLLFGSFCRSKKNVKTFPFRELPDKQEVCPCRGSTLRVLFSFRQVPRLANLESSHRSHPFRQKPTKPQKTEKKGKKARNVEKKG